MPKLNSLDDLEREVRSSGGWSPSNDRLSWHIPLDKDDVPVHIGERVTCSEYAVEGVVSGIKRDRRNTAMGDLKSLDKLRASEFVGQHMTTGEMADAIKQEMDTLYMPRPLDKYGRVVNVGDWLRIDGFEKAFIVRGYALQDDVWEIWDSANGHTHACNECYHVGERPLEDVLAEFGDRYATLVSLHSPQAEKETLIAGYADELENISGKVAELDAHMMKSDIKDMQKLVQDKEAQITELEERCAKMSQWAHNVEELLAKTCREARGKVYEARKAKARVEALERLVRDMWFENLAHAYERCSWCTADCSGDYECDFSRRIEALGIEK